MLDDQVIQLLMDISTLNRQQEARLLGIIRQNEPSLGDSFSMHDLHKSTIKEVIKYLWMVVPIKKKD